jgi:hypothetical protein
MAISILHKHTLQKILTKMWQAFARTHQDPANGQWYTTDPHDTGGLYGALSDSIPEQISFNSDHAVYRPASVTVRTTRIDNRNGLNPSPHSVTLEHTYTKSLSNTHTVTKAVSKGAEFSVEANAEVVKAGAKFSINFTFSSTDTRTETKTETVTFSQSVPVTVPEGKVYEVVLTAEVQNIEIPYTVPVKVSGATHAWWENPINPRGYHWSLSASEAFDLIRKTNSADSDSAAYQVTEDGEGMVVLSGVVKASQVANFLAAVYDVTDQGASADTIQGSPVSPLSSALVVQRFAFE